MASLRKNRNLGKHVLVDFFGIDPEKLRNQKQLMIALRLALRKGGFRIVGEAGSHKFKGGGQGVTGFFLLAQSHAAFHSYPEYGYMALDIYSCGKQDPKAIVKQITRHLKPRKVSRILYPRGQVRFF